MSICFAKLSYWSDISRLLIGRVIVLSEHSGGVIDVNWVTNALCSERITKQPIRSLENLTNRRAWQNKWTNSGQTLVKLID